MSENPKPLAGYRFLVVEDEMLQAWRIGEMVVEMGGAVAEIAYGFEQARDVIGNMAFDGVILDINLNGTLSFRLIDTLKRDKIPFVFCTAYTDAVDVYPGAADAPRVSKPVRPEELRDALLEVLEGRKS